MNIINTGPDTLDFTGQAVPGCSTIVYYYENHGYDGSGSAVALIDNPFGNFVAYRISLGHCSCYGPLDEVKWDPMTLADVHMYLGGSDSESVALREKVYPRLGITGETPCVRVIQ